MTLLKMLESPLSDEIILFAIAKDEFTTISTGTKSKLLFGSQGITLKTPSIVPTVSPRIPKMESENPAIGSSKVA